MKIYKNEERENIKGVYQDDIELLLNKLDLLEKIQKKQIKCPSCKKEISIENIGIISKDSGTIKIYCDNNECIKK